MSIACLLIHLSISHASHVATDKSTRPHGARRDPERLSGFRQAVSIRAPTWGATIDVHLHRGRHIVQIHAPRGARPNLVHVLDMVVAVSIHAPARGATAAEQAVDAARMFQSTRPRGARRSARRVPSGPRRFNPRARAGRDRQGRQGTSARCCFNPRVRAGRDTSATWLIFKRSRFQSTRPRGARRLLQNKKGPSPPVSIHAPARGATFLSILVLVPHAVSIHAPARGATLSSARGVSPVCGFNPRARAGRDECYGTAKHSLTQFQSTRPRGARPHPPW